MLARLWAALVRALHAAWQWLACARPAWLLSLARRGWLVHAIDEELDQEHPDARQLRHLKAAYYESMAPAIKLDIKECQAALETFAAATQQHAHPPCCPLEAKVEQRVLAGLRARDAFLGQELRFYQAGLEALRGGEEREPPIAAAPLPVFSLELPTELQRLEQAGGGQLCESCREQLEEIEAAEDTSRKQQEYLESIAPASKPAPRPQHAAGGTAGEQQPAAAAAAAAGGGLRRRQP